MFRQFFKMLMRMPKYGHIRTFCLSNQMPPFMRHHKMNAIDFKFQYFCNIFRPVTIVIATHNVQISKKTDLIKDFFFCHIPCMQNAVTGFQYFQHFRTKFIMRIGYDSNFFAHVLVSSLFPKNFYSFYPVTSLTSSFSQTGGRTDILPAL